MGVLITIDSRRYMRIVEYRGRKLARNFTAALCEAALRVAVINDEIRENVHRVELAATYQSYLAQYNKLLASRVVSLAEYREVRWAIESYSDSLRNSMT